MKTSDEELFERLDPELARTLFPERFTGDSIVTVVYPPFDEEAVPDAAPLQECATEHEVGVDPTRPGAPLVCRTSFTLDQLEDLHSLYGLLEERFAPGDLAILIDGHRLPLVRKLWLPLLWNLRA